MNKEIKIIHYSDTHEYNRIFDSAPEANLFIHTGDLTGMGGIPELQEVAEKLQEIQHRYDKMIVIPGNHDWGFQHHEQFMRQIFKDMVVLINEPYEYEGVKFWGSPITPIFSYWAFMKNADDRYSLFQQVPEDTKVLLTHGPAYKVLDEVAEIHYDRSRIDNAGCLHLFDRIQQIKPRLHLFGHIHEGYGHLKFLHTDHVNSSIMDGHYRPVNKPHLITYSETEIEIEVYSED